MRPTRHLLLLLRQALAGREVASAPVHLYSIPCITSCCCCACSMPLNALTSLLQGMKVAVIEGHDIGGTCVNRGCVPSKALLAASGRIRDMKNEMHMKSMGIQVGCNHSSTRVQEA